MSQDYAMEALLRPPVEFWSALTAVLCAGVACFAPWALMMPDGVGYITALCLMAFAWIRFRGGFRVWHYCRQMKRMKTYTMKAKHIPVSNRKLFLGRGFQWMQVHTQRLRDTARPEVRRFIEPGRLFFMARRFENDAEGKFLVEWLARITASRGWWNPLAPLPPVGGKPQIHAVEVHEENVLLDLRERVGHTLVVGTTRVGKTRLAEILISQDIRRKDITIVIDPKGDPDLMRRVYAEAVRAGRLEQLYVFHLGFPELSARYNTIGSFSRITEVASRVTNPLPSSGNSAAFREFAWRYTNIIAKALHALGRKPDYRQIQQHINDIEPLFIEYATHWLGKQGPKGWESRLAQIKAGVNPRNTPHALKGRSRESIAILEYVRLTELHDPVLEALASVFKYDRTYFDKTVSSLGPLLEKLTSGKVAELLSPNYLDLQDPRPIFDWMQVIRQGGIVYMGLDALTDAPVASAFGTAAFADLVSVAGHLYKHGTEAGLRNEQFVLPKVSLHCDEFSDLMGDEFVPMANKIGGAGFQLTVYTQSAADIEANASSKARAHQVIDNLNTLVMLRVKSAETAELLTSQLPEVQITSTMMVSGVTDTSADGTGVDFVSRNEDRIAKERVPLLYPSDIMDLPKGQAFILMEGGHLWKARMPLPDAAGDDLLPDSVRDLADKMHRSYRTSEQWWVGAQFGSTANADPVVAGEQAPANRVDDPDGCEEGVAGGSLGQGDPPAAQSDAPQQLVTETAA